jgi:hypothetical protein
MPVDLKLCLISPVCSASAGTWEATCNRVLARIVDTKFKEVPTSSNSLLLCGSNRMNFIQVGQIDKTVSTEGFFHQINRREMTWLHSVYQSTNVT